MMKNNDIITKRQILVLASASPRRAQLLEAHGLQFQIIPADLEENTIPHELPQECALRLSFQKASKIAKNFDTSNSVIVLGADTLVVLDNQIMGKPVNSDQASLFLHQLSGKTHEVVTGYTLIQSPDKIITQGIAVSHVTMQSLTTNEIEDYIASGEPFDKAGAYAIQGIGKRLIQDVKGSINNVIGLPIEELSPWFKKLGLLRGASTH